MSDQSDALAFFRARAHSLARHLNIDPLLVNEAAGIITSAFGATWVQNAITQVYPGNPLALRRSELGNHLHAAGLVQAAEVLELVEYLKEFSSSSHIQLLISGIKHQYDATLLQLAMAFRLAKALQSPVTLEPPALNGRLGDIGVTISGHRLLVECYHPAINSQRSNEAMWLLRQCLDSVRESPLVYSFGIQLHKALDSKSRKELIRIVRNASQKLAAKTISYPILIENELATISVATSMAVPSTIKPPFVCHPQFLSSVEDADLIVLQGVALESEALRIQSPNLDGETRTQAVLWFPPEISREHSLTRDLDIPLMRLADGVEEKFAQTKQEKASRMVIVETWMTDQVQRASPQLINRFESKLLGAHIGVEGIILVSRHWNATRSRHFYTYHPFYRKDGDMAIQTGIKTITAFEQNLLIPARFNA